MAVFCKKSDLSSAQKTLLEILQRLHFGRIQNLHIKNGEPILNPAPLIHREVKFGGDNSPRPELRSADFGLKAQVVELFEEFRRLGNGVIDLIEVKHGLPFRMMVNSSN
jgi:hypothetical protein